MKASGIKLIIYKPLTPKDNFYYLFKNMEMAEP